MAKLDLIGGFKDPVRRPRFIIWTGVTVMCLIAFVVVALGVTSTRWFCAEICHKVQDDSILAYELGSHSEISCLACHMPVNASPPVFLLHKIEAGVLGGLHTVTDKFIIPLNKGSVVSMEEEVMGDTQCTQCHSKNREITPSEGIVIDHAIHEEAGVWCALCHNRVAHPEDAPGYKPVNVDPTTGELNPGHPDFMKMDYCFRCHTLEGNPAPKGEWKAPGACSACHTPGFDLKPASHDAKDFYPKGHAELAMEDEEKRHEEAEEAKELIDEGIPAQLATPVEYCLTCHVEERFCNGCHGMEMPHPEEFKAKSHPEAVKKQMDKCIMCHGVDQKTHFCSDCHHGEKSNWEYDPKTPWINQHAEAVSEKGFEQCLGACHEKKFCIACHTSKKPVPTSHKAKTWLHRPVSDPWVKEVSGKPNKAIHAQSATENMAECELCHGTGGANSKFCRSCHKLEMAHPATFKDFHAKTGRKAPGVCLNCHQFKEICSNCHHEGSSTKASWTVLHGPQVYKAGDQACFEKCHKQDFCVACHNAKKPVPTSHRKSKWTRDYSSKNAGHASAYESNAAGCGYCHGTKPPAENKFCLSCHKLAIPHPSDFKETHKKGFEDKKLKNAQCVNCHKQSFCDGCHHDYTGGKPWKFQHDNVVAGGADPQKCFECHEETYCSHCHVRLIH